MAGRRWKDDGQVLLGVPEPDDVQSEADLLINGARFARRLICRRNDHRNGAGFCSPTSSQLAFTFSSPSISPWSLILLIFTDSKSPPAMCRSGHCSHPAPVYNTYNLSLSNPLEIVFWRGQTDVNYYDLFLVTLPAPTLPPNLAHHYFGVCRISWTTA